MKQRVEPRPVRALALQRGRSLLATLVEMTFAPPFRPPPRHFGLPSSFRLPPSFRPPPVISSEARNLPRCSKDEEAPDKAARSACHSGSATCRPQRFRRKKGAPIMGAPLFTLGMPGAYSCGPAATSALPASLVSYFLKLLMKRSARSCALASHSAGSA